MNRTRLIVVLAGLAALGPLSIDMYLPALPSLTDDFHTTASAVQLTLTACLVGLAGGQLIAGPISDAKGRRRPLLTGLVVYTVASALCVVAPTLPALVGLRLLQGLAGGVCVVIARAMVRDLFDGDAMARFFTTLAQVAGLAPILAPILGSLVLLVAPWPGVFGVIAGLGILLILAAWRWTEETLPARSAVSWRGYILLLRDRVFLGYTFATGFALGAMFVYISGSPFVLQELYHLSPLGFSIAFAANGLGIVLAARAGRRLPAYQKLMWGLGISLTGGILLPIAVTAGWGLPGVLPALFLVVAGIGLSSPGATTLALSSKPPEFAGRASALLGLAQFSVGGLAAPLAGLGGGTSALPMALTISALTLIALATFSLVHFGRSLSPAAT